MKLTVYPRTNKTKGEKSKIRQAGDIPAVIYGPRKKSQLVFVKGEELRANLRKIPQYKVPTTVVELSLEGKNYEALIKEIQTHRTSYKMQHIDFFTVEKDKQVKIDVPIVCLGVADCEGVRLGGMLRQVIRYIPVECLPSDIPDRFTIDVTHMTMGEAKRLSDLTFPAGVKPLAKLKEVVVTVGKR